MTVKERHINPGDLVVLTPYNYDYNPDRAATPKIGFFIELLRDPTGWRSGKICILTNGREEVWNNRWHMELLDGYLDPL